MAITSRYVQLSNWALLEYVYESQEISTTLAKTWKIENAYSDTNIFINGNESTLVTNNVLDTSSNNMANLNIWSYNDVEASVPIIHNDTNLTLSQTTLGTAVVQYDTVKVHMISGFNFELSDGFILKFDVEEKTGKFVDLSNYTFLKGDTTQINYNPSPIMLGDRVYDRWVEFQIPSLKWITDTADSANSISKLYTSDTRGFVYGALINATLFTIQSSKGLPGGNTEFISSDEYKVSFLSEDTYSSFVAVIEEPSNADYFELYGLWNGEFMEDYINGLNSVGGDWSLIHSFEVFEQIGIDNIKTTDSTYFQSTNFDQPLLYRPVILNAGIAFSFSINYSLRLYNAIDGMQIIRQSSITSLEPKKYGKQLEKINVNKEFNPTKIYNKIADTGNLQLSSDLYQQNLLGTQTEVVNVYIPTYYSNIDISSSAQSNELGNFNNIIFGQNKGYIFLNRFDNIIRFKIYRKDKHNNTIPLDIPGTSNIRLSFILDNNEKLYISRNTEVDLDITSGELEFKIPQKTAIKILSQTNKKVYYITSSSAIGLSTGSDETVLYSGRYDEVENRDTVEANALEAENNQIGTTIEYLNELRLQVESEERRLTELRNINIQTESVKDTVVLNKATSDRLEQNKILSGYMDALTSNSNAVIREIPGVSLDLSSNLKLDTTPQNEDN